MRCVCECCGEQFDADPVPRHMIGCGDATDAGTVARLMGGGKAGLCFTSPPYAQQRDYGQKITDWLGLMQGVFANLPMADDGQVLVNLGLIHRDGEWVPYWEPWIEWMRGQGWRRFGWYVWDQGSGLPGDWGGRFAPSHEFVFHFNHKAIKPQKFIDKKPASIRVKPTDDVGLRAKDGTLSPISNPEAFGQPTKIPDSVVRINRSAEAIRSDHPAVFPLALPTFILESWPGDVYDPFAGSFTTLIAAHRLGRRAFCLDVEPRYVDVGLRRVAAEGLTVEQINA